MDGLMAFGCGPSLPYMMNLPFLKPVYIDLKLSDVARNRKYSNLAVTLSSTCHGESVPGENGKSLLKALAMLSTGGHAFSMKHSTSADTASAYAPLIR